MFDVFGGNHKRSLKLLLLKSQKKSIDLFCFLIFIINLFNVNLFMFVHILNYQL